MHWNKLQHAKRNKVNNYQNYENQSNPETPNKINDPARPVYNRFYL
jgi:hypothetical protein